MTVVWNVYANRVNMGDWASMLGTRKFLDEVIGNVEYRDAFCLDGLSKSQIDEINDTADLVVVGGGGLWQNKPSSSSGWLWNLAPEALERIKPPLVFWGVGLNDWYHKPGAAEPSDRARANILAATRKAALVGVRDQWTHDWLASLGGSSRIVPCPSLALGDNLPPDTNALSAKILGINVLPKHWLFRPTLLVGSLVRALTPFAEHGWNFRYIPHSQKAEDTLEDLMPRLPGTLIKTEHPLDLIRQCRDLTAGIVMRQHAQAFLFDAARPAMLLSYSRKCTEMGEHTGFASTMVAWTPRKWLDWPQRWAPRIEATTQAMLVDWDSFADNWAKRRNSINHANLAFAKDIAAIVHERR